MKKSIYLALCISVLFIFTSCEKNEQPPDLFNASSLSNVSETIEYETAKVTRGELEENITESDIVVLPRVNLDVRFDHDVILKKVYVNYDQIIKKGDLIAELYTEKIEEDIELKRFMIEQEKALYNRMRISGKRDKELRIQALEIEILEEKLKKLIKDKEEHKIYAQTDCYIVKGDLIGGRKVEAGESVFVIADATKFIIKNRNEIDMTKFANFEIGDGVKLSYEDQEFRGWVCFISFDERNSGEIHFQVDNTTSFGEKKLGDITLKAKFDPIVIQDVLTIPKVAVKNNQKDYVETIKDGVRRVRYIQCGVEGTNKENLTIIQVVDGLKEGENVILKTKSTLDGEPWY